MNILTFDIEEWFHCDVISNSDKWSNYEVRIHSNTDYIIDKLNEHNRKATFFILGWVAKKYPELVKKIKKNGHEIGCHSMWHRLVHTLTPEQFKEDTYQANSIIEDIIGEKVIMYRAPAFSITENTPWAFDILLEQGIKYDASIFSANHDYGGYPSLNIYEPSKLIINGGVLKEFPMNTKSVFGKNIVFSGGGFFRLLPYQLIKNFTNSSDYVMTYFHPRDFDKGQPVLPHLSKTRRFKSYYGLNGAKNKLSNWLNDFESQTILNSSKNIDWDSLKEVKVN